MMALNVIIMKRKHVKLKAFDVALSSKKQERSAGAKKRDFFACDLKEACYK